MPDFDEDDEEFIEWNITNFLKNGKEVEKLPVTPASLTIFAKVGSIVLKYLAKKLPDRRQQTVKQMVLAFV